MTELLKQEEKAIFALRELYQRYGYSRFKMSKFEPYDLYMQNKDFLVSDGIITFTDTDGKLMALKPDVTLSIIKNVRELEGFVQKVYYSENVYRISGSTRQFKEIMQTGLECLGDVDLYSLCEVISLAAESLDIIDPDNVLESGIEIKAAPPGKIIKNMVQLSGGEQSFIAIALFFAILQVNPTPFCILDEIEAALDEVNVARFAEYIKRYASETQFILITHRRGTMEAANRLYGVTMPERGISKVLELDINDISKKKGEDWDGIFG